MTIGTEHDSELTRYRKGSPEETNSSSSYIFLFHPEADRDDLYEVTDDFLKGRDFKHFVKKFVDDEADGRVEINYKTLFTPTSYTLKYIVNEYLDHVKILKRLRGLKTPLTPEEELKLEKFYELNNWNDKFKNFIKNRKIYGDDYHYFNIKNVVGYGDVPILQKLDRTGVDIVRNPKDIHEIEYIYNAEKTEHVRDPKNINEYKTETTVIQLLFTKGKLVPYINGEADNKNIAYMPTQIDQYVPLIHFQYLQSENNDYSEIPSLDLIDNILRLHRIETDIAEVNSKSGAPQQYVIDGNVDKDSRFGARCIAYIDTTVAALKLGKQAQLKQSEITNGLDSLYKEQSTVLNALFTASNLIPPSVKEILAKSDSSKAIRYLSADLIEELRIAYEEISDKTKVLWKILFPERNEEDISLEIPIDLYPSSLIDKGQYINANVMTIKEMLRDQGRSKEEIDIFLTELNEQIQMFSGQGLNIVPVVPDTYEPSVKLSIKKTEENEELNKETDLPVEKSDMEGYKSDLAPMANTVRGR